MRVWLILRLAWVVSLESCDRFFYIRQNIKVHFAVVVILIKIHSQIPFALPIMGDFVVLLED